MTDLESHDGDCISDIRLLPFPDDPYNMVYASHVLEHVEDDRLALRETVRILRPGGVAVLPVPSVSHRTIEYRKPNLYESYHIRAPGYDYFERCSEMANEVKILQSEDSSERFQTFVYEDRSRYFAKQRPVRPPMNGKRHRDFVSICHV